MTSSQLNRDDVVDYLKSLRNKICKEFESFEPKARFVRTAWPYGKGEGGGEMSVIRGDVFEKAAVNWSGLSGEKFPMGDATGPFFATGVSLITHMANPKVPTVHFNIRYLETQTKSWLGGGYDLTPMGFEYDDDTRHFHSVAKTALDASKPGLYESFSQAAKEYFFIKHRKRERGVGGIFFDHYNSGDQKADFKMWRRVGDTFLDAIVPILKRRVAEPFSEADRKVQLERRGHYVEFNLLYDRGTKFGFESGGNHEAILCSMPPVCGW